MTAKVEHIDDLLTPDHTATYIADRWQTYDSMRNIAKNDWDEVKRYVFATDTGGTTNSMNPWKNSTVIPKLCQIRDNLLSNYMATNFPNRKAIVWEANERDSDSQRKRDAITNYMTWVMQQPSFKTEMRKCVSDYIDYGNCFATVEWVDQRSREAGLPQAGYVGPVMRRISPLDIVFNPAAEDFVSSPKIIRSMISMGELKEMLQRMSNNENQEEYEELWDYLVNIRSKSVNFEGDLTSRDAIYAMEGFTSFSEYLSSDTVEVLTFYGDLYDSENDIFLKNHVITVVDRHKLIGKKANPSYFTYPPIFHCAWRVRQDNLWGMGPLVNLVGMQYRLNHVENMKADIYDLVTYPVQKVKGFVEDFTWQPGEKIYVSEEGDVELITPDVNALNANFELQNLERMMEEMAGAPKEAMGFRSPGEKTKYEVQRMENASSRIFQSKSNQFDENFVEPLMNAKLELSRRNMSGVTTIKVFDDELKFASFQSLTVEDVSGIGRIKPIGSRHFAEQAELIQNLTTLTQSPLWQTVQPHFSGIKLAKIIENAFNLEQYEVVLPNVALAEQAEAAKQAQVHEEGVAMASQTATGMGEDFDMEQLNGLDPAAAMQEPPTGEQSQ